MDTKQKNTYLHDRTWGDAYVSQVMTILNTLLSHLVELEIASDEKDRKYATDFNLKLKGGDIAVRLRRSSYQQRDLTIRSRRDNGAKTELAKIKEGYGSRYFYGWTDDLHKIVEWILVDLDKLRSSGLLEINWYHYPNKDKNGKPDGTHFIAIPAILLRDKGCLLDYKCPVLPHKDTPKTLQRKNTIPNIERSKPAHHIIHDSVVQYNIIPSEDYPAIDEDDPFACEHGMEAAERLLAERDLLEDLRNYI